MSPIFLRPLTTSNFCWCFLQEFTDPMDGFTSCSYCSIFWFCLLILIISLLRIPWLRDPLILKFEEKVDANVFTSTLFISNIGEDTMIFWYGWSNTCTFWWFLFVSSVLIFCSYDLIISPAVSVFDLLVFVIWLF